MAKLTLLSAVVMVLIAPLPLAAFHPSQSISAGVLTGAYYPAASAVAKMFNRRSPEYGARLTTVESAGSLANLDAVLQGKSAFGMAQADVLQQAAEGLGRWEGRPQKGLRAVLGLHAEAVTIVAAGDRGIQRVSDLRGKRVNLGAPGSSDRAYAAALLEAAGVSPGDLRVSERSAVLAPALLQANGVDAYVSVVGHPNLALVEATAGKRMVRLIPLEPPVIQQVTARHPLLFPAAIPTAHYPSLDGRGGVPSVGVRALLFTRADMPEQIVYRLVHDVLTNFDLFRRQHPVLRPLAPRDACGPAPIPAHPGAGRACRDAGAAP
ncbi:MAG: TAXI family TRAP transporter solute-binding subunit [Candidatus Methylomirabilales bacterium]